MEPTLRLATTDADRAAAYGLAYELYVEEQGLLRDQADHSRRWLCDECDAQSLHVLAESGGQLVGMARITLSKEGPIPAASRRHYAFDHFLGVIEERELGFVSRLMVSKAYRGSSLATQLFGTACRLAADHGAQVLLGASRLHLVNYYWLMGLRPFDSLLHRPESGLLVRTAMVLKDLEHLRAVDSPILPFLSHHPTSQRLDRIRPLFAEPPISSHLRLGDVAFRQALKRWLPDGDRPLPTPLEALSKEESAPLFHHGHLLELAPGSTLMLNGYASRAPLVLLTGSLEKRHGRGPTLSLETPGATAGWSEALDGGLWTHDLVTGPRGARVLALHPGTLKRLAAGEGPLASRILAAKRRELEDIGIPAGLLDLPESPRRHRVA